MKFDTEGTYTLTYTATDSCGNSTSEERTVVVTPPPRTVLYNDGTFIINDKNRSVNEAQHGGVNVTFEPMLPDGSNYVFASRREVLWGTYANKIKHIEFGQRISPIDMKYWFGNTTNADGVSFNGENLDTSRVTSMQYLFSSSLIASLDASMFDTRNVTNMNGMFWNCTRLEKIYATELFDTSNVTDSGYMFDGCAVLVGGAGTVFNSSHTDKEYARIDNPPDAPGYFTLKPSA